MPANFGVELFAVGSTAGTAALVQVFNGAGTLVRSIQPFGGFTGGVRATVVDVTRDGRADVVVAPGAGGGPEGRALDALTGAPLDDFFALDPGFRGGVFVGGRAKTT